jgi:ribonuclease HI
MTHDSAELSGSWTVHIDGSALPNPGRMAVGAVLMDPKGVLALLAALDLLAAHQVQHAHIYSDSSILVEQINSTQSKPIARLSTIYAHAKAQIRNFESIELHWVPRQRNLLADALARAALGLKNPAESTRVL